MNADILQFCWVSDSLDQTLYVGELVGRSLVGGLTIALVGPLGAGKTQLVKGIARGNEVADASKVTSPTFTLVHEYPGRFLLYHLDAYRLGSGRELLALGFEEMARDDSVVVVEWADRMREVMPPPTLWITIVPTGDATRNLLFTTDSPRAKVCARAAQELHR